MLVMSRWKRRVRGGLLGVLVLSGVALVAVKCAYGGGEPYPDVSTAPALGEDRLSCLIPLELPPGNVSASPDGRIFYNLHPFAEPDRFSDAFVFEWKDGKGVPFPSQELQAGLYGTLGMTVDRQNRLWLVRPEGIEDRDTRLVAIDLTTNAVVVDYAFPRGTAPFAQDLRVTPDGKYVILADTGIFRFTPPALIVFDVERRTARRVLEGHPSVSPQDWVITAQGEPYKVFHGLVTFSVGVDGVAIDDRGKWLYYATMSHDAVYRVPLDRLTTAGASDADLAAAIERVGPKPLSDGIALGPGGLLITDVEHGGLMTLSEDGKLSTLVKSPKVIWADGVTATPEGDVLFTDSAIPSYIDQLLRPPAPERVKATQHCVYKLDLPG